MLNFKKILEGFRNDLVPPSHLKAQIEKVSAERLEQCLNCPFNTTHGKINVFSRCSACGCFLTKKAKCLSCSCGLEDYNERFGLSLPLKWVAVTDVQTDTEIENIISDDPQP